MHMVVGLCVSNNSRVIKSNFSPRCSIRRARDEVERKNNNIFIAVYFARNEFLMTRAVAVVFYITKKSTLGDDDYDDDATEIDCRVVYVVEPTFSWRIVCALV